MNIENMCSLLKCTYIVRFFMNQLFLLYSLPRLQNEYHRLVFYFNLVNISTLYNKIYFNTSVGINTDLNSSIWVSSFTLFWTTIIQTTTLNHFLWIRFPLTMQISLFQMTGNWKSVCKESLHDDFHLKLHKNTINSTLIIMKYMYSVMKNSIA